jgi:hypothetical protein
VIPTYAVIPSQGRASLLDCLASLRPQVEHTFVIANGGCEDRSLPAVSTLWSDTREINVSRWWNLGLDAAAARSGQRPHNTLLVNDDVILGPDAVGRMAEALRRTGAALAFPGTPGDAAEHYVMEPGPPRITGWCFMLRGELGSRADERFRWWFGDNDLDWTARSRGGSLSVPGVVRTHLFQNEYTHEIPELSELAVLDGDVFLAKWGRSPSSTRSVSELVSGAQRRVNERGTPTPARWRPVSRWGKFGLISRSRRRSG